MGNADTKLQFRQAVVTLIAKTQPVDTSEDSFWDQFWGDHNTSIQDIFTLIPASEIRALREQAPSNLASLCYKAVEKIVLASDVGCSTLQEQTQVLNCVRILTRLLPYTFEDPDWSGFFWSDLPSKDNAEEVPLAHSLVFALCDLLFCPDFTVAPNRKSGPDKHEDLQSIDSCEYIWDAGVGFASSPPHSPTHESNRTEILKLLLTCFSQTIYQSPADDQKTDLAQKWITALTSLDNRHALPLFTSLLNTVCGYNPSGVLGVPYNHLLFTDSKEPLVEVSLQILIAALDHDSVLVADGGEDNHTTTSSSPPDNLFVSYLSRIHREEDFCFVLKGFTRLLTNPLQQTYFPHSVRRVNFHQELLVFFWKFCDFNKKFLFYVLKSSEVLDILVPILYHLNDARADQSRVGLMHIGVFILLLLSGERNFGVRLNKPYAASFPMDIPVFTGTHSDLLIIVFYKIVTTGHQRLQPLFDCLLTILVNISPYIKTMSMVASTKLLHLLEAFSTPWFLMSAPHHHHFVFSLLEIFNNIIQYQFDGNSNLVYTIIRKRQVFHSLANMSTDFGSINKSFLNRRGKHKNFMSSTSTIDELPSTTTTTTTTSPTTGGGVRDVGSALPSPPHRLMEGSKPALPAQPGTKTVTLAEMPAIDKMTERESAHPTHQQLNQLTDNPPSKMVGPQDLVGTPLLSATQQVGDGPPSSLSGEGQAPATTEEAFGVVAAAAPSEDGVVTGVLQRHAPSLSRSVSDTSVVSSSVSTVAPRGPTGSGSHSKSPTKAPGGGGWVPSPSWVAGWKAKLPLQTIMRLLQVLVPQVEKICIDKGLTDESEILRFLQHGTLVGLLPVPHPILIRKYQANAGTSAWFRTYMWGVIYLRSVDPPIWYDTNVKLFEIQRV